ncbi:leucine-rich repeat domain-containing protein [Trueperella bialowiezensis]|uniref:Leucine-rich repeat domain-containing protein n=1 Tax=Trueperella bialowiezensis TaxID=312285 RepID=A0A3S4UYZ1_9ACTO|nr:leucine-rich repeat domain-containing protein [Trueperella bialowiezensis]VEI13275.1 Uncharacterised protein [Trueperella bialowiezensis]
MLIIKNLFRIVLASALVITLSACGGSEDSQGGDRQEKTSVSSGEANEDYFLWEDDNILALKKDEAPTSGTLVIPKRAKGITGPLLQDSQIDTVVFESDEDIELYQAFYGAPNLKHVELPSGLTEIGDYSFASTESLEEITIPENVKVIGQSAFSHCKGLKKVTMGNSVTEIKNTAFINTPQLTELTLSENVESIGSEAFYLTGLTEFTIPKAIKTIGYNGLYSESFESFYFPEEAEPEEIEDGALFLLGVDVHVVKGSYMDTHYEDLIHGGNKVVD